MVIYQYFFFDPLRCVYHVNGTKRKSKTSHKILKIYTGPQAGPGGVGLATQICFFFFYIQEYFLKSTETFKKARSY